MSKTMTPSNTETITDGQICKINELLSAKLRKSGLLSEPVQQVLENQGEDFAKSVLLDLQKRADAFSEMIVRTVTPDRTLSPQQVLDNTGRKQYTTSDVVENMPKGDSDETEVVFFKLGKYISDNDLEQEYEKRGLKPADPYSLAKVNEDDPSFADDRYNCTHWKGENGKWCHIAFYRCLGERSVGVGRRDDGWCDYWWFAGVRK